MHRILSCLLVLWKCSLITLTSGWTSQIRTSSSVAVNIRCQRLHMKRPQSGSNVSFPTRRNIVQIIGSAAITVIGTGVDTSAADEVKENTSGEFTDWKPSIQNSFKPEDLLGTTSSWPNTPSPLPTMFHTAAELSSSSIAKPSKNLDEAIKEAAQKQKRRIDPTTHG